MLMIPLAITSTAGWIRRMGGKRWQMLHRAIYITAIAGVIHYLLAGEIGYAQAAAICLDCGNSACLENRRLDV